MKEKTVKITFLVDRQEQAAGGRLFSAGKEYDLPEASALHWKTRGVAVDSADFEEPESPVKDDGETSSDESESTDDGEAPSNESPASQQGPASKKKTAKKPANSAK